MDRIVSSSHDRTSLLSTHKVLRNTYFLLSLTLAFSAITATASTVLMLPSPGLILTLVGMYGLMFLTYKTANKPTGIISAFAFTGFLGYILGPILNTYLSAGMGDVIGMALGGTALVFFCCSAYVLTTRKDMSFLGGMLMAGIVVVLMLLSFHPSTAMATSTAWGCVSAASNAVSATFCFLLAVIWSWVSTILPMSKPNSKRWVSTACSPRATTWKTSVS